MYYFFLILICQDSVYTNQLQEASKQLPINRLIFGNEDDKNMILVMMKI